MISMTNTHLLCHKGKIIRNNSLHYIYRGLFEKKMELCRFCKCSNRESKCFCYFNYLVLFRYRNTLLFLYYSNCFSLYFIYLLNTDLKSNIWVMYIFVYRKIYLMICQRIWLRRGTLKYVLLNIIHFNVLSIPFYDFECGFIISHNANCYMIS